MQHGNRVNARLRRRIVAQAPRNFLRILRHTLRMAVRIMIFDINSLRERQDHLIENALARLQPRIGQCRLPRNLLLQLRLQILITQDALHAQPQHIGDKGLVQEIRHARTKPLGLALRRHIARQHDDGHLRRLQSRTQLPQHRHAIEIRHKVIQEHEIKGLGFENLHALRPAMYLDELVFIAQDLFEHHEAHLIVIHGQHARSICECQRHNITALPDDCLAKNAS